MPENGETVENNEAQNAETQEGKRFAQEEVNRIVQERLAREREKYADYEDLKARAAKADELEESQKSEADKVLARAEKAEERLAEVERERDAERVSALRSSVAAEKGVPAKLVKYVTGESREEIEASAEDLAGAFAGQTGHREGFVPPAGTGGYTPNGAEDAADRAKAWVGRK